MSNLTQSFHGAMSFGKGTRLNNFISKEQIPSPNHYALQTTLSTSATKFGKSLRPQWISNTPSVGHYDIDIKEDRKLKITIKGKRKQDQDSSVVGYSLLIMYHLSPGSYSIEPPKTNRKYGFGDRFLQTYESEAPAPNYYNLTNGNWKKSANRKNGFMLGNSKQDSIYQRSKTPAPNQYETSVSASCINQTFAKAPREAYYLDTPGPGSYHYDNKPSKGFSFLSKYKTCQPPNYPGPGQYELANKTISNGTIKFNSIKRQTIFSQIKEGSPGPGAYIQQTNSDSKKGIKFNAALKLFDYSTKVPGPGKYENNTNTFSQQGGVMGKLYRPSRISTTPGPGQYDLVQPNTENELPSRWSKSKRFRDVRPDVLGPGSYNVDQQFSKTGISFTKGKNYREPLSKLLYEPPGPGHYDLSGEVGFIPQYLITK